jgi:hypothetical protein
VPVWTELPADITDLQAFKELVAQAHQHLAQLPGAAGEQFRAVMRCLEQAGRKSDAPRSPEPPARP